jgi:predicted nucleic acid-binding Zn ribbon protein
MKTDKPKPRKCITCGSKIPPTARADAVYCSVRCRFVKYQQRHRVEQQRRVAAQRRRRTSRTADKRKPHAS